MNRIIKALLLCLFVLIYSGCSCSKENLITENQEFIKENEELMSKREPYLQVEEIFNFYNNITIENVNSFVLVESKNKVTSSTLYADGIVIANSGYDYYILTDYNKIYQNGLVEYRIMDSNASVYTASLPKSNGEVIYDEITGMILLKVNVATSSKLVMEAIKLGEVGEIVAHISSVNQINKIQISEKIKTSTIEYNSTSYNGYLIEDLSISSGALINLDNRLCGVYLSNVDSFIDYVLIKEIVYINYSLIL